MFQFHNGTINTSSFCAFNPPFRSFNSTTVQLIHLLQYFVFALPLFQFHNGTINTQVISFRVVSPFLFQFHNGTINTIITVLSAVLTGINCTVVELKLRKIDYVYFCCTVLIVPLWNWNHFFLWFCHRHFSINCTVVELKHVLRISSFAFSLY